MYKILQHQKKLQIFLNQNRSQGRLPLQVSYQKLCGVRELIDATGLIQSLIITKESYEKTNTAFNYSIDDIQLR